jgi:hypothetical protein
MRTIFLLAAVACSGCAHIPLDPLCRGRPGGTCSTTTSLACAYDSDCPKGESCAWTQAFARLVDNGNGTVTDRRTCLQWEKKTGTINVAVFCTSASNCPDPRDVNNEYTWSAAPQGTNFDGLVATLFLSQLNSTALAGHTDWRLPTSAGLGIPTTGNDPELESIADPAACPQPAPPGFSPPCIDPIFGPTYPSTYWSSSTVASNPRFAWEVEFKYSGSASGGLKSYSVVRAVRGAPGVP